MPGNISTMIMGGMNINKKPDTEYQGYSAINNASGNFNKKIDSEYKARTALENLCQADPKRCQDFLEYLKNAGFKPSLFKKSCTILAALRKNLKSAEKDPNMNYQISDRYNRMTVFYRYLNKQIFTIEKTAALFSELGENRLATKALKMALQKVERLPVWSHGRDPSPLRFFHLLEIGYLLAENKFIKESVEVFIKAFRAGRKAKADFRYLGYRAHYFIPALKKIKMTNPARLAVLKNEYNLFRRHQWAGFFWDGNVHVSKLDAQISYIFKN